MTAAVWRPLRAEWIRLSQRWDLWLVVGLLIAATAWLHFSEFRENARVMGIGDQGGWGNGDGPPAEPWFIEAMLSLRQPFAFPGSLVTVLDSAWVVLPLGAYVAAASVGPDFWWGTMRTILVTRRRRAAYLAHRLLLIAALIAGTLIAALLLAILMQVGLSVTGERFPASQLSLDAFWAMFGVRLASSIGYALIAALLTLLARSLVGGIVLTAAFVAVEFGVGAIAGAAGTPIVRELTLSGAVASVVGQLRPQPLELVVDYELGALVPAAQQPPAPTWLLPLEVSAVIMLLWISAAAAVAFLRMETMDITD